MHGNMNINYSVVKFIPHIFIIGGAFYFLKKRYQNCERSMLSLCRACHLLQQSTGLRYICCEH
jgi:hypothetical protein